MKVTVTFDPCSLRPHDYRADKFGLSGLVLREVCTRCGEVKFNQLNNLGGIFAASGHWLNAGNNSG